MAKQTGNRAKSYNSANALYKKAVSAKKYNKTHKSPLGGTTVGSMRKPSAIKTKPSPRATGGKRMY